MRSAGDPLAAAAARDADDRRRRHHRNRRSTPPLPVLFAAFPDARSHHPTGAELPPSSRVAGLRRRRRGNLRPSLAVGSGSIDPDRFSFVSETFCFYLENIRCLDQKNERPLFSLFFFCYFRQGPICKYIYLQIST